MSALPLASALLGEAWSPQGQAGQALNAESWFCSCFSTQKATGNSKSIAVKTGHKIFKVESINETLTLKLSIKNLISE